MSKLFHTIPCDCERGGDCSKVTRCCLNETIQQLEDQVEVDMHEQQEENTRAWRETSVQYQHVIHEQDCKMYDLDDARRRWRTTSFILLAFVLVLTLLVTTDVRAQEPPPGFYRVEPWDHDTVVSASWDDGMTPVQANDTAAVCAALSIAILTRVLPDMTPEEQQAEYNSIAFWHERMRMTPEDERTALLTGLTNYILREIPTREIKEQWMNCARLEYGEMS